MKTRFMTGILLVSLILAGCSNTEVRPGVDMSNDPADFAFPTSGYAVYIVGETHGNRETKLIFLSYLQRLYEEAGLRDVILEEDQAHESDANAYVRGETATLPARLCLRADILGQIREFNASLPTNEKVSVHLVDVDSPLGTIHKHLGELHAQLGPAGEAVHFPDLDEFRSWRSAPMYELIDELRQAAGDQPDILNGLDTVQRSLEWYYLGNRLEIGRPRGSRQSFAPLREDVMTQNIQRVLSQLNGQPVLAFFGFNHGIKKAGDYNLPAEGFKPWAQRLVESDVSVYSLAIVGTSGNGYWHKEAFAYEVLWNQQYEGMHEYQFPDGTFLLSLFETHPELDIIHVDLQTEDNARIRLPSSYDQDIPASRVYDGLVIFREFTPMEDACPE